MRKYCLLASVLVTAMARFSPVSLADDHGLQLNEQTVKSVQGQQAKSIEQGIRHGRITPREAEKLKEQQQTIQAIETTLAKDGKLDGDELRVLFEMLEEARDHINRLLRNRITSHAVSGDA